MGEYNEGNPLDEKLAEIIGSVLKEKREKMCPKCKIPLKKISWGEFYVERCPLCNYSEGSYF